MVLVGLGMEAAFLGVMQRCAFLRRDVHKCIELADRAASQKAREVLILQMGEGHRKELSQIECSSICSTAVSSVAAMASCIRSGSWPSTK
jgi:hypothetical protein